MADLKTDYKDDILDTSQNTRRKYQMVDNGDGTVSFVDVTEYIQQGDSFGADDVNAITDAINKNDGVPVGAVVTFDGSQLPSGFEPYTTAEQTAIAQINDNLSKHTISTDNRITLAYNTEYTTLADGYFWVNSKYGAGKYVSAYMSQIVVGLCASTAGAGATFSLFCRKGSIIKYGGSADADTSGFFYPLA